MSEVIVIARLRVMATDAQLLGYRNQMAELQANRENLLGVSSWRSLEADGGFMQIMRYPSTDAADEALEDLMQSSVGPLVASLTIDPPDVAVVSPRRKHGKTFEEVPIGGFASFAMRFSDPGQQEELELDTDEVLAELAYIPGYLGSLWGNNITLPEEIVSIVTWATEEALISSIPKSHKVKVQKWQKAF